MRARGYPRTECRQPVTCGQGTRHLTCSPICPACHSRIPSIGHKCTPKKSRGAS